jgi:sugar lactone lactonase YvrE
LLFLTFLLAAGSGFEPLELTATQVLDRPAVSIDWSDNGTLAILDAAGEKVFEYNPKTGDLTTRILPERIAALEGIRSDPLFFYFYRDNDFYRLKKITDELEGPLPKTGFDNLKIVDMDIAATGEMFIADGFGDRIVAVDPLGSIRELGTGYISRPKGVRVTAGGEIVVINAGRRTLAEFNRVGSLLREIPLPSARITHLALDEQDRIYVSEVNTNKIWRLANGRFEQCAIAAPFAATGISAGAGKLFILDANTRLLVFDVPE